jgi:hypothetical protein
MQFDTSTPRQDITIQGAIFSCPMPFHEGYPLKANEASAMNGLLAENLRNNVVGKFSEGEGENRRFNCTQEQFDEYASQYEFGARRGSGEARLSPVEREARKIAREKVNEALKAKGKKLDLKTEQGRETMEALVSQLAANPAIVKEAEKRVKATERISVEELGLDFSALSNDTGAQQEAA